MSFFGEKRRHGHQLHSKLICRLAARTASFLLDLLGQSGEPAESCSPKGGAQVVHGALDTLSNCSNKGLMQKDLGKRT